MEEPRAVRKQALALIRRGVGERKGDEQEAQASFSSYQMATGPVEAPRGQSSLQAERRAEALGVQGLGSYDKNVGVYSTCKGNHWMSSAQNDKISGKAALASLWKQTRIEARDCSREVAARLHQRNWKSGHVSRGEK